MALLACLLPAVTITASCPKQYNQEWLMAPNLKVRPGTENSEPIYAIRTYAHSSNHRNQSLFMQSVHMHTQINWVLLQVGKKFQRKRLVQ